MCDKESSLPECLPIKTYFDLLTFSPEIIDSRYPKKCPRSNPFKVEEVDIDNYNLVATEEKATPKTLVCHDMKGGYLDDRFRFGNYSIKEEPYRFIHWSSIDTFVYFSHHFITIPPRQWIDASHRNGVNILGTIITESSEGEKICSDFLKDESTVMAFVQAVVKLTTDLQFDGWLLNIENKLTLDQVNLMVMLLKNLKDALRSELPHSQVIWYDAVTRNGDLTWQNELNELNKVFFDHCDGIFLNYGWSAEKLESSLKNLDGEESRRHDVYVGVDVFGRGCFGGGGFNSCLALEAIREKDFSAAIFAPGWTHEVHPSNEIFCFPSREYKFWHLLRPFLFVRGPFVDDLNPEFHTFFGTGCGQNCDDSSSWWLNMTLQEFQPSVLNHPGSGIDSSFFAFNCNDTEEITNDIKPNHLIFKQCNKPWMMCGVKNVFPLFACQIQVTDERHVNFQMYARGSQEQVMFLRDTSGNFVQLEACGDSEAAEFRSFTFKHVLQNSQKINFLGLLANDDLEIRSFHINLL